MPAANPTNAYAPERSHREILLLSRSDDVHHAASATIAAQASASTLINGKTCGLRDKSRKTVGGSMTVQKRTVEDRCGLSRWTADATADLLRRWVDMAPPQRSVFELPNKKRALGET